MKMEKRYSPLTNPVGAGTSNVTFNLKDAADAILTKEAIRIGGKKNAGIREFIATGMEKFNATAAKAFRSAQNIARPFLVLIRQKAGKAEIARSMEASVIDLRHEPAIQVPADLQDYFKPFEG